MIDLPALGSAEDRTGLCTVRDVAAMLDAESSPKWMEMCFKHNGKWMNVEIKLTRSAVSRPSEAL